MTPKPTLIKAVQVDLSIVEKLQKKFDETQRYLERVQFEQGKILLVCVSVVVFTMAMAICLSYTNRAVGATLRAAQGLLKDVQKQRAEVEKRVKGVETKVIETMESTDTKINQIENTVNNAISINSFFATEEEEFE
jgi:hypothetical protein